MWSHGNFYWNELNTRKLEDAKKFYGAMLGWTYDTEQMPEGPYCVIKQDGKPVGGIFVMNGPKFEGVPEHWLSYIAVDNVDERVKKLKAGGGSAIREAWDVPGVGRIAIVKDANGAVLGLMTPAT
jgi:predicted enzyme related to lactoylglutathione lyase